MLNTNPTKRISVQTQTRIGQHPLWRFPMSALKHMRGRCNSVAQRSYNTSPLAEGVRTKPHFVVAEIGANLFDVGSHLVDFGSTLADFGLFLADAGRDLVGPGRNLARPLPMGSVASVRSTEPPEGQSRNTR